MAYQLGGGATAPSLSTSPMLGGMPPGYLGNRKGSITSMPPVFASIQEDAVGESHEQQASGAIGHAPSSAAGIGSNGARPGYYSAGGQPPVHAVGNDHGSRPSTASSPFRYSVSYDSNNHGYPGQHLQEGGPGYVANDAAAAGQSDAWSPDWKSLTQPAGQYGKAEIR